MLTRVTREIQTLPHFNHFICTFVLTLLALTSPLLARLNYRA